MTRLASIVAVCAVLLWSCSKPVTEGTSPSDAVTSEASSTATDQSPAPAATAMNLRQLFPVDESASDPSFAAFKTEVLDIAARKDVPALLTHVASDIKNSFGGNDGIEEFKTGWKLSDPQSELWPTLRTILTLGATKEGDNAFGAPYVFTRWPEDLDSFSTVVVVKKDAALRSAPSRDGTVVRTLGYEFLELGEYDEGAETGGFTAVKDQTGKAGYVAADDIRSPIAYRAFFEKRGDKWLMVFLVSGD